MSEEPIRLVPYDPSWPARFTEEAEVLQGALDRWLVGPIEHVGSTAVPGLTAKPIASLAEHHGFDREAYTEAKVDFVRRTLAQ